ncbi:MAG TPA: family 43 glycosylhydrolase [Sunxiuqinia sp.]|nr:family 43 glycosylhydrolase [Sunxiuqinia sp.]
MLIVAIFFSSCQSEKSKDDELAGYVFTYFTGNGPGQESIHFAVSEDGYHYRALNNNQPILDSKKISSSGGVRDPHLFRGEDGKSYYMVATDLYVTDQGWHNYAMVLMKSNDLIHWETSIVNIPKTFPDQFGNVNRVWAPQTIYDNTVGEYMIYFSMKQDDDPDKIYYAYANKDFTGLETTPKQLYFPPEDSNTKACIDADIIPYNGKFCLFHKAEDGNPGIKLAISKHLTEGYQLVSPDRVDASKYNVEGSGIFKLNNSDEWILMYDLYKKGGYQFTKSSDLRHFEVIDQKISMNFHPRHGTVLPITRKELKALISKWGTFDDLLVEPKSKQVKKLNVYFKGKERKIELPVKHGTDLSHFDPEFSTYPGITFTPSGPQDFTQGPVEYTAEIEGKGKATYAVLAEEDHNPVLEGYYADPDILYAEKTGNYYLYPTSDGFNNWSGTYFKVFSSDDLVDWKDEGVILDLKKDVNWANRNAWAPCIIEKKIKGKYKYFYYFTAAQKIGVAVADNPTGPFVDSGKPLVAERPDAVRGGQEIDPDVFTDPKTGKSYFYWGNGHMMGAELNDDMTSFKKSTLMNLTPNHTFREGTYVFYRKGKYYFMWSEGDTRSTDYRVRYATANSPLGKLHVPENNLVIAKDPTKAIYGTGHNAVLQVPGTDDWYIVYHRFTRPKGITMGRAAGFHREVCIDKLTFDSDGNIIQVQPTLKGIEPLKKQ